MWDNAGMIWGGVDGGDSRGGRSGSEV